ncbi:hypothetical protein [Actinomyces culturomici]|uniref:hypothetical protein n=1 Tax=Actinomyces culturomici TaxID=1926276 RepID=UPI000E1FEE89|nr:hypothetical protein [Actinomyces culturomici]
MAVINWFESMTAGEQGLFVLAALTLIGSSFWAVFTWLRPNPRSAPETTKPPTETPNTSQSETTFNVAPAHKPHEQTNHNSASVRPRVEITWASKNAFTIRNIQTTPLAIEYVRNRRDFVRLDLDDRFTLDPGRSIRAYAFGAWGKPIPDELVLDVVGEDTPLVVPLPPHPEF